MRPTSPLISGLGKKAFRLICAVVIAGTIGGSSTVSGRAPAVSKSAADTCDGLSPTVVRGFMTAKLGTVTPDMLSAMRNTWGANVIRLQMFPVDLANSMGKSLNDSWPAILDVLDQTVANANAVGLKVVVDMHQAPFNGGIPGGDEKSAVMWNSAQLTPSFVVAWKRIAQKLKPRQSGIWAFDLYNEPAISGLSTAPPQWRPLALKLAQEIHGIAPTVWVAYDPGPGGQATGYKDLTPLADDKVVYEFHDYIPYRFTHQGLPDWPTVSNYPSGEGGATLDLAYRRKYMQPVVDFQKKYQVPIFVGEFSAIRWAPKAEAVRWLQESVDLYEANGWSWTYHAFREWGGWSLEHDETRSDTTPVNGFTDRGRVILNAMRKNKTVTSSDNC